MMWKSISRAYATPIGVYLNWLFGHFAVGMLFFEGEMDSRDKVRPIIGKLKAIKVPLFVIGLILLGSGSVSIGVHSLLAPTMRFRNRIKS